MEIVCCDCGELFPLKRYQLGYRTCLACGDLQAKKVSWATVPLNKSNYVVVTDKKELTMLNPKRVGD